MTDVDDRPPRHRRLTPSMRAALKAARSQPLRRVHDGQPGRPPWPAAPNTLYALWRHELLAGFCRRSRKGLRIEEWTITDAGREALKSRTVVAQRRPPLLIAEGWPDFTRDTSRAMRGEPGVLPDCEPAWLSEAA